MTDDDLESLKKKADATLLAFLRTEATIGKTFASLAKTHSDNADRYRFNKSYALQALETIDRLIARVPPDAKAEIEASRAELAAIIAEL